MTRTAVPPRQSGARHDAFAGPGSPGSGRALTGPGAERHTAGAYGPRRRRSPEVGSGSAEVGSGPSAMESRNWASRRARLARYPAAGLAGGTFSAHSWGPVSTGQTGRGPERCARHFKASLGLTFQRRGGRSALHLSLPDRPADAGKPGGPRPRPGILLELVNPGRTLDRQATDTGPGRGTRAQ